MDEEQGEEEGQGNDVNEQEGGEGDTNGENANVDTAGQDTMQ